jgi:hypothetical protein
MDGITDTARFRSDDPDELVSASLACPICLHEDQLELALESDRYDPSACCHCRRCERGWRVYVTPLQELRLRLMLARAA